MAGNDSNETGSKMSGWQINSYTGIKDFKFTDDIPKPKILKATEILVQVLSSSLNQIDERMTGRCSTIIFYLYIHKTYNNKDNSYSM